MGRKLGVVVLAVMLALPGYAQSRKPSNLVPITFFGKGAKTCGQFLTAWQQTPATEGKINPQTGEKFYSEAASYIEWAQGYLFELQSETLRKTPSALVDPNTLAWELKRRCEANPTQYFMAAVTKAENGTPE